jgi:hypothetical protein
VTEIRGTDDLKTFNQTWAPHSGSPKVFPRQLAVTVHAELLRLLPYVVHLDTCIRFETLIDSDCSCGLVDLQHYVRRLAPHKYDGHGDLKPEYAPKKPLTI